MSRLVDADELMWRKSSLVEPRDKTVSNGKPVSDDEVYAYRLGWNDAIDAIMEYAPTVNAVPVVRCRDCKWREKRGRCKCKNPDMWYVKTKDEAFCSWGERREDDNT